MPHSIAHEIDSIANELPWIAKKIAKQKFIAHISNKNFPWKLRLLQGRIGIPINIIV